jgi:hypothetical protein
VKAANTIGKPIFMIETAEHYENGFDSNDPWYNLPSQSLQAQFLNDLQAVQHGAPKQPGDGHRVLESGRGQHTEIGRKQRQVQRWNELARSDLHLEWPDDLR